MTRPHKKALGYKIPPHSSSRLDYALQIRGKTYEGCNSVLSGRTYGVRPFSQVKLLAFACLASCVVAVFGFMWGAGNIY
jgi:hypothetical protein